MRSHAILGHFFDTNAVPLTIYLNFKFIIVLAQFD